MKSQVFIILLLLLLSTQYCISQDFVPISADETSKWKVGYFNYDPPNTFDETRVYYLDGQTVFFEEIEVESA